MRLLLAVCALWWCGLSMALAQPKDSPNALPNLFAPELEALWELVACGEPLANTHANAGIERIRQDSNPTLLEHCKALNALLDKHASQWQIPAKAFFQEIRPANAPKHVVYPFAGGDLLTALIVYPDAESLTTISLEAGGDPRGIFRMTPQALKRSLSRVRTVISDLLFYSNNRTVDLDALESHGLPAQLSFALIGLRAAGYTPVSLSSIELQTDGKVQPNGQSYLDQLDKEVVKAYPHHRHHQTRALNLGMPHYELRFRSPNSNTLRIYRHFRQDLSNDALSADPRLLTYLKSQGPVSVLVKGASHLLWRKPFSTIRDYLQQNLKWMVSDSTGINPMDLDTQRLEQIPYGTFKRVGFYAHAPGQQALRKLYADSPKHTVPFRFFGYPTGARDTTLIVTRPR